MATENEYNYTTEYSQYISDVEQYRGKDWKFFASDVTFDELKEMYDKDLTKIDDSDSLDVKNAMATWQKLGKSVIICASNAQGERTSDKSRYTYDTGKYELVVTAASGRPIRIGIPASDYNTTYFKVETKIEGKGDRKISNDVLSVNVPGIAKVLTDDPTSKINQKFTEIDKKIQDLQNSYNNLEKSHKALIKEFSDFKTYTYQWAVWRYDSSAPTYLWNGSLAQYNSASKTDTKGKKTLFVINR